MLNFIGDISPSAPALREGRNREPEGQSSAVVFFRLKNLRENRGRVGMIRTFLGQMSVPENLRLRSLDILTQYHIYPRELFLCDPVPLSFGLQ